MNGADRCTAILRSEKTNTCDRASIAPVRVIRRSEQRVNQKCCRSAHLSLRWPLHDSDAVNGANGHTAMSKDLDEPPPAMWCPEHCNIALQVRAVYIILTPPPLLSWLTGVFLTSVVNFVH